MDDLKQYFALLRKAGYVNTDTPETGTQLAIIKERIAIRDQLDSFINEAIAGAIWGMITLDAVFKLQELSKKIASNKMATKEELEGYAIQFTRIITPNLNPNVWSQIKDGTLTEATLRAEVKKALEAPIMQSIPPEECVAGTVMRVTDTQMSEKVDVPSAEAIPPMALSDDVTEIIAEVAANDVPRAVTSVTLSDDVAEIIAEVAANDVPQAVISNDNQMACPIVINPDSTTGDIMKQLMTAFSSLR